MTASTFDPNLYLSKVKGRDYLEVKWRIAWMRHDHPTAILETELISNADGRAIMRARVELPDGGSATGWGSETEQAFENYIEKAETKAIGRALTALGYGTPFNEAEGLPVSQPVRPVADRTSAQVGATGAQRGHIQRLSRELGLEPAEVDQLIQQHTGAGFDRLNKRQASGLIDLLQSRLKAAPKAS